MKTHVDSGNSILQISMESQENTSANSIKSRPINQRKRLSPAQRRKQITQEAVTLITQYGSYGFPMQALADAVGMTLPGLNHYVKNREELLSLVIETFYDSEEGNAHTTLGAAISHCDQIRFSNQRTPTSARCIARNRALQRQTSRTCRTVHAPRHRSVRSRTPT